jgi:protease-4
LEGGGNVQYIAAASADFVLSSPVGQLWLKGLRVEMAFLKRLLEKIGVEAEFTQIGSFKSAAEIFTREDLSPEASQMMNSLLDDLYGQMVGAISRGRKIQEGDVRNLIDAGPYSHKRALEAKLFDHLIYEDELEDWIAKKFQTKPKNISPDRLIAQNRFFRTIKTWYSPPEIIAMVHVSGLIQSFDDTGSSSVNVCEPDSLVEGIKRLVKDRAVKGLIVRVNSPGGTEVGSDKIWRAVSEASKEKPVVASMSNTAASGGYYIAMGARKVIAEPGTITGSIGVLAGKFRVDKLADRIGAKTQSLDRGKHAGITSPTRAFTEEEKTLLKKELEDFYQTFLDRVASGRKMEKSAIEPNAQGRVWTGRQAIELGLVDSEGGIDEAIDAVKKLAGIPAWREIDVFAMKGKPRFPINIPTQLGLSAIAPLSSDLQEWTTGLLQFCRNCSKGSYSFFLMPWVFEVD